MKNMIRQKRVLAKVRARIALRSRARRAVRGFADWLEKKKFRRKYFAAQYVDTRCFTAFRREHFPESGPHPWLDRPDAKALIEKQQLNSELSGQQAERCRQFLADGIVVLEGLISHTTLDRIWLAYEEAIASDRLTVAPDKISADDPYVGRYVNPHSLVPEIKEAMAHPELLGWLDLLIGRKMIPYQSITSHKGTQQAPHSDAIHMTTYPLGYLAAAWVAFEDIHPDSGPLFYYPGSHRLPYFLSEEVGIPEGAFQERGSTLYHRHYEPFIADLMHRHGFKQETFSARKGDVLIWHHNLVHGGSTRHGVQISRKAIVFHYFAQGALCYHDLDGSPTREEQTVPRKYSAAPPSPR